MKKTWAQKRDDGKQPIVKRISKTMFGMAADSLMLISSTSEIDKTIRELPAGTTTSIPELRALLAKKNSAEVTCPVSTGIFLRIVAEAALEEIKLGKSPSEVTPFWRVVLTDTSTAKKLSIDPDELLYLQRSYP